MSQSASSGDNMCGLLGEAGQGGISQMLPRSSICHLGFHSLPFSPPPRDLPSRVIGRSQGWPSLGKPPASRGSAVCLPS